jgi:excisionase family DNA binding protein
MIQKGENKESKFAFSVEDVARATTLSKAYVRNEIRAGHLKAIRAGRRVLVPASALDEYLSGLLAAERQDEEQ